jgi:hypothetical protein
MQAKIRKIKDEYIKKQQTRNLIFPKNKKTPKKATTLAKKQLK